MNPNTEIQIPEHWESCQLRSCGVLIGGGTPSRARATYWNGSIPWASVKDFSDEQVFLYDTEEHISQEGLASSAANLVPENTPIICTRMAVGRCALTTRPTAINQDLKAFLLKDGLDKRFFIRLLRYIGPELDKISVGSTVRGITIGDILSHTVLRPQNVDEQTRIAYVLDSIDKAIATTEAVIAKLKQVRAGVLHDLLSCGLDEHGQLRDPIAHPEQFKDSPLGRIPKDWEVKTCETLCRSIVVGIVVTPAKYYEDTGIPVLRSANISEDGLFLDDLVFISARSNALHHKSIIRTGDVLTVRTGYPGSSCVVPSYLDGSNCVDLIISRPNNYVLPEFLALWINSSSGKYQVLRVQGGLAQQHFNIGEMRRLLVPVPDESEQLRIVALWSELKNLYEAEEDGYHKLQLLKSGLQDDLLTGRVRVPETIIKGAGRK